MSGIVLKSCLCACMLSCFSVSDFMDHSPTGSSFHGILQARIREWDSMPSSRGSSQPRDRTMSPMCSVLAGSSLPLASPANPVVYLYTGKQSAYLELAWRNGRRYVYWNLRALV